MDLGVVTPMCRKHVIKCAASASLAKHVAKALLHALNIHL